MNGLMFNCGGLLVRYSCTEGWGTFYLMCLLWHYLLVFFLTGIFANVVALSFYPSSLGASGAIFCVIGCLVVIRPLLVVWAFGLPMPLFVAGALWVIGAIIGVFVPSGVGNIAHLSGIALGIFIGLFLRDWKKRNPRNTLRLHEGFMRSWEDRHLR